jgi:5,10-methylenetetrahydromethanopterin reductase
MLYPFMTAEAVHAAVERMRRACEDSGRDPASLHVCHPIVVAPELDDFTTRAYAHARAVTYLEWPGHGEWLTQANGWDQSVLRELRGHRQFGSLVNGAVDQTFHRADLMDPARLVPDAWMQASCAIGSVGECVDTLQTFRDAGADEIAIYASTPAENAALIAEWRRRHAPVAA